MIPKYYPNTTVSIVTILISRDLGQWPMTTYREPNEVHDGSFEDLTSPFWR